MHVRRLRRLDKHNAAFASKLGQGGAKQGDFADAGVIEGKFDQGTDRPALAGQFVVELGKAGGKRGPLGPGKLGALPESRMDMLWAKQRRRKLHGYALILYLCTVYLNGLKLS